MNNITNFEIEEEDLGAAAEVRQYSVFGDIGSKFILQVVKTLDQSFYNFSTRSFQSSFTPECNFKRTMVSTQFDGSILFPSSGTTDYKIILLTPTPETQITINNQTRDVYGTILSQLNDVTVTFAVTTANTSNYSSNPAAPNITSVGIPSSTESEPVSLSFSVTNADNDTHGFGLQRYKNPELDMFYVETTGTIDGAVTASNVIKMDSVTGLSTGLTLFSVDSGSLTGSPIITAIDQNANTITVSVVQASLNDNATITFRAYGSSNIFNLTGLSIDTNGTFSANYPSALEKRVRADGGITEATDGLSTTIALVGTRGLAGSLDIRYEGPGVDNSSTNTISAVSLSETAGTITVTLAQVLKEGTTLRFIDIGTSIDISLPIVINQYPSSDTTVYIQLDEFIRVGEAS